MDPKDSEGAQTDPAEEALRRGDLATAAALLRHGGQLARAQALYERIWDHRSASEVARERGDRPAALRLLLDARDPGGARLLLTQILQEPRPGELPVVAALCEGRRLLAEASLAREALGELPAALTLAQRAQLPLRVATLAERLGDHRQAALAYQEVLRGDEGAGQVAAQEERLSAHLGLARALQRFSRHEDAARHLQQALQLVPTSSAARTDISLDLVTALARAGLVEPAQVLLERLQREAQEPPVPLSEHLQQRSTTAEPERLARSITAEPERLSRSMPEASADPPPARAADAQEPTVLLGRYEVQRLLGSGGMSSVYLAQDRLLSRLVALKLVPRPAALDGGPGHDERVGGFRRFLREAELVRALRHPAIVQVHDFHEADGMLTLEYMAGGSLAERPLPLPLPLARRVLLQVLQALAATHARGVIHRDIKPQNVFFTLSADAKLGDFGVAHLQDLAATQTAGFVGTLAYMAPEQISGAPLTFATDIYSLGVMAFQMVTGRLPFLGPDFVAQHLADAPPSPSSLRADLPAAWEALILQALRKDPQERPESLAVLLRAVERLPLPEVKARTPALPAAPPPARAAAAPAFTCESPLGATAHSTLHHGHDPRIGRAVLIERFHAGVLQGEAGAAQLRWLRALAQLSRPGLQRVLLMDLAEPEAVVVYEAPLGQVARPPLPPAALAALRWLVQALHQAGVVHGAIDQAVLLPPAASPQALPLLLIAGHGPLHQPGPLLPDADLAALGISGQTLHAPP